MQARQEPGCTQCCDEDPNKEKVLDLCGPEQLLLSISLPGSLPGMAQPLYPAKRNTEGPLMGISGQQSEDRKSGLFVSISHCCQGHLLSVSDLQGFMSSFLKDSRSFKMPLKLRKQGVS